MEYQQMPQQLSIGPPAPSPSPHLQLLQNGQQLLPSMVSAQAQAVVNQQSHHQQQQQQQGGLPNMPLQIVHQISNQIGLQNPANGGNMTMPPPPTNGHHMAHHPHSNGHNGQSLPAPNQILQQLHQNGGVVNGNGGIVGGNGMPGPQNGNMMDANNNVVGGGGPDEGNRWTHQVQQLWRHHAYLNGNAGLKSGA